MTGHAWVTYGLLLVVSVVLLGVQIWNAVAPGGAHESPLCNDDSNCTRGMMLADGTCEQWLLGRSEPCHDRCMRRESRSGFCNAQGKCVANWTDSLGYCVSHEDAGCDAVFQLDANFWGAGAPYYAQEHIVDYQAQCEYNQCVAYAQGTLSPLKKYAQCLTPPISRRVCGPVCERQCIAAGALHHGAAVPRLSESDVAGARPRLHCRRAPAPGPSARHTRRLPRDADGRAAVSVQLPLRE